MEDGNPPAPEIRFAIVPEWVLEADHLPDKAVRLYALLAYYDEDDGGPVVISRHRLAERLRCSVATIDRNLAHLVAAGAVAKTPVHIGRQQRPNVYWILSGAEGTA